MLSCLYFVCHGRRSAASLDRATQQEMFRKHDQQLGKSHLGKFVPLRASASLPGFVARDQKKDNMCTSDTNEPCLSKSKHSLRPSFKQSPKAFPFREDLTWQHTDLSRRKNALQSLLGESPEVVRFMRPGSTWRHSPVGMQSVLETQRGPPKPPGRPPSDGGGSGGDGDGPLWYLRALRHADTAQILTDWIAKTKVYEMTKIFGNVALAGKHATQLLEFERLLSVNPPDSNHDEIILALHEGIPPDDGDALDPDKVRVLALASVTVLDDRLVLHGVVVSPIELNDPESTAAARMLLGLSAVAEQNFGF